MKKVLYVTVKVVPYRTKFFNEWSKCCDLTVAYETGKSGFRDSKWANSEELEHKTIFLDESRGVSAYVRLFRLLCGDWDAIVVGCCNIGMERIAVLFLRLMHIPFILNFDGESFFEGNTIRAKLKRWFVKGAKLYLIAGEQSKSNLEKFVKAPVIPYYFSSLYKREIGFLPIDMSDRKSFVLVVGQYLYCKGLDVILKVALRDSSIKYKFVGMGVRQDLFIKDYDADVSKASNVEFIPFLQKKELEEEYKKCALLVLPSRQECWGLVINESASFGTPIVSTYGSGAAVEFLQNDYPQYLVKPGDEESLYKAIKLCLSESTKEYSSFLIDKAEKYTIEKMVECHNKALKCMDFDNKV